MDDISRKSDVYLYGMTLITSSYRLAGDFPRPDTYGEITESHRLPGGETGTCAVVLDSLGLSVQLDGNHLGRATYPELSSFFESSGVSLDLMTLDPTFEGLEDLVFIDHTSRTVFGRFEQFFEEPTVRRWNTPSPEAIDQAEVAGIDPFFLDESIQAAQLCKEQGVKFATIDCAFDSPLHRFADVNILSAEYLSWHYPDQQPESLFTAYIGQTDGLVIFTFGSQDLWFGRQGQELQRFTPYQVPVESTLGAGDSFKAGVIFALYQGMQDAQLVRFASATAAAACSHYPIAEDPPTLDKISKLAGETFPQA